MKGSTCVLFLTFYIILLTVISVHIFSAENNNQEKWDVLKRQLLNSEGCHKDALNCIKR